MTAIELTQMTRAEVIEQNAKAKAIMKENIIARLGDGLSLLELCDVPGFPTYHTVIRWSEKDEQFSNELKIARIAGGYKAADKAAKLVDSIIDEPLINEKLINPALTHLRWIAERQSRATFGQTLEVKHSGTVSVRTSFLIPRSKQSVDDGEVIDLDSSLEPAQLAAGDDWMD